MCTTSRTLPKQSPSLLTVLSLLRWQSTSMSGRRGQSSRLSEAADEEGAESPGNAYLSFIRMEELLDKLKLLNYDHEFVSTLRMKPLNKWAYYNWCVCMCWYSIANNIYELYILSVQYVIMCVRRDIYCNILPNSRESGNFEKIKI